MKPDSHTPKNNPDPSRDTSRNTIDIAMNLITFPAMSQERAVGYLDAHGFLEDNTFLESRVLHAATNLAVLLQLSLSRERRNDFITAVYCEQLVYAEAMVYTAYRRIGEQVPDHIRAIAAIPHPWGIFLNLTANLLDRFNPEDPDSDSDSDVSEDDLHRLIEFNPPV